MTSQPRGGAANRHSRRAAATLGAVSAGLLVLSACDEPTPMATVTLGKESVHTEAECYEKLSVEQVQKCTKEKPSESIELPQGETLRVGVDPEISKTGWALWIDGEQATNPFKKTYYTFENADLFAVQPGQQAKKSLTISVVEQNKEGTEFKGVWNFTLTNPDA
ncbi:hypothetical protein Sipo8835_29270 [Streptomyces ipomoeae]|jgi:hypothetical protein|nr:hypothetical protein [Streptomyces ipomoeae]MDX2695885.1 hypothetical protein [Streptomyces ipomoeae]MDX2823810.1 hypothetical protein [Streptomyces ipomoeae]MDX2841484.1 hypothetical protein [Streptomyces ipomoeae]MDX2876253.1 hypothetical protein [Streptomyces ipomoeae]MDX2932975.1 hypothetical protein [Streptomyces ipomoeae]